MRLLDALLELADALHCLVLEGVGGEELGKARVLVHGAAEELAFEEGDFLKVLRSDMTTSSYGITHLQQRLELIILDPHILHRVQQRNPLREPPLHLQHALPHRLARVL